MFWSDLVFGQKQGGNYEKPSRVSRLAAGAADARLLRPRPRAGRESIDADQRVSVNLAASGGRAVDRTDAWHANSFRCQLLRCPQGRGQDLREARPHYYMAKCGCFRPR